MEKNDFDHLGVVLSPEEMLLLCFIPSPKIVSKYMSLLRSCSTMEEAKSLVFAPLLIQGIISEETAMKKKFHVLLQPFVQQMRHHSLSTMYRSMLDLVIKLKNIRKTGN